MMGGGFRSWFIDKKISIKMAKRKTAYSKKH
jgi:hypothetical protein